MQIITEQNHSTIRTVSIISEGSCMSIDWPVYWFGYDEFMAQVKGCQTIAEVQLLYKKIRLQGVRLAMVETRKIDKGNLPFCWWSDQGVNTTINDGVSKGWLLRPSTSQVEWTQKGILALDGRF